MIANWRFGVLRQRRENINNIQINEHLGKDAPTSHIAGPLCRMLKKKKTQKYLQYILIRYIFAILNKSIMKNVSLKIDDSIFGETEKILSRIKKPRNRYINEAIDYYNKLQRRLLLEKKLKKESDLVKKDSMSVLKEFEEIDYVD